MLGMIIKSLLNVGVCLKSFLLKIKLMNSEQSPLQPGRGHLLPGTPAGNVNQALRRNDGMTLNFNPAQNSRPPRNNRKLNGGFLGIRVFPHGLINSGLVISFLSKRCRKVLPGLGQVFISKGLAQAQSCAGGQAFRIERMGRAVYTDHAHKILSLSEKYHLNTRALCLGIGAQFQEAPRGIKVFEAGADPGTVKRLADFLDNQLIESLDTHVGVAFQADADYLAAPLRSGIRRADPD